MRAVALAVALAVAGGAPAGAQPAAAETVTVNIKARQVDPEKRLIRTTKGTLVAITFTADERTELHLHGYDLAATVEPAAPAALRFTARVAGRFALEAHAFGSGAKRTERHTVLLYLEVHPR